MSLLRGDNAIQETGTTPTHSKVFQQVANETKCVIASRAVGKYATGLLMESYATKGFHNKAKSCNWGPMAGFVLSDPRFTKRGDSLEARMAQRKDLFKAFKSGASEIPIFISEARRQELLKMNCMRMGWIVDRQNHYYFASSPTGKLMLFHLSMTDRAPGAMGKPLWAISYAYTETALSSNLTGPTGATGLDYLPVTAMVDPDCSSLVRGTYRSATTGDYDLFAVFPQYNQYQPRGVDQRPVPGTDRFKVGIGDFIRHEDPHLGNITSRVKKIMLLVNCYASREGYSAGKIVHHSDEAGRPLVNDIDFPFIAWKPREREPYGVVDVPSFKHFIQQIGTDYKLLLNPGWFRELGFGVTPSGSFEV